MKHFLVVGSGVAGCAAAGEFALLGHRVTLLESSGRVGGKVLSYCCKATDSCSRCGVCVAHTRIGEALSLRNVTVLTGARIDRVDRSRPAALAIDGAVANPLITHEKCIDCGSCLAACPARCIARYSRAGLTTYSIDHSACLLQRVKKCSACADACPVGAIDADGAERRFALVADGALIAAGHETFDPACKPRLGYGRVRGVMTGFEAEQALSHQAWPSRAEEVEAAKSVAFIQCVGSRDPGLCRNFCSAVCCAYALRMSRMLVSRSPGLGVTVYYIDIQSFDKAFSPFRAELEMKGVKLVRGIPSSVERSSSGRLRLLIEDPRGGGTTAEHDLVVLSVGIQPAAGSVELARLFGLQRDDFGFLRTALPTVTVAGTCAEPQGIVDSVASARAAAREMLS